MATLWWVSFDRALLSDYWFHISYVWPMNFAFNFLWQFLDTTLSLKRTLSFLVLFIFLDTVVNLFLCWLACFQLYVACPMLKRVPHVLVIHGEGDGTLEYMKVGQYLTKKFWCWRFLHVIQFHLLILLRETSLLTGFSTSLHCPSHTEHTIQKPCFLSILEACESLYIQQTWYTWIGITKPRVCGCKIFHGKIKTVQVMDVDLKMTWLTIWVHWRYSYIEYWTATVICEYLITEKKLIKVFYLCLSYWFSNLRISIFTL